MSKVTKVPASRVSKAAINANRMASFSEISEGYVKIVPINIRNIQSFAYHVAEDVKGDVYLIRDDDVMLYGLLNRNMGVATTPYMLDGPAKELLKSLKEKESVEEETEIKEEQEVKPTKKKSKKKTKKTEE